MNIVLLCVGIMLLGVSVWRSETAAVRKGVCICGFLGSGMLAVSILSLIGRHI